MTVTINGSGTIGGISVGGLNDNIITKNEMATGGAWAPAGTVLQVVQQQNFGKANTYTNTTSGSYADMTNMVATITPTAATSKILVISVGGGLMQGTAANLGLRVLRNGSAVWTCERFCYSDVTGWVAVNYATTTLDSPATTSAVTYKFQFAVAGGVSPTARIGDDNGSGNTYTAVILMEIAA